MINTIIFNSTSKFKSQISSCRQNTVQKILFCKQSSSLVIVFTWHLFAFSFETKYLRQNFVIATSLQMKWNMLIVQEMKISSMYCTQILFPIFRYYLLRVEIFSIDGLLWANTQFLPKHKILHLFQNNFFIIYNYVIISCQIFWHLILLSVQDETLKLQSSHRRRCLKCNRENCVFADCFEHHNFMCMEVIRK